MKRNLPSKPSVGIGDTFQRATVHHQRGEIAEAAARYQEVLAKNPRHAGAIHGLGTIASHQQQHQRAIKLIGFAISIDPNNYTYHHNEGGAYQAIDQLEQAINSYTRALQLNPNSPSTWYNRGVAYLESGKPMQATSDFNETIRLTPTNAQAFFNLGNCHTTLKNSERALEAYEQAIKLDPTDLPARVSRAATLRDVQAFDRAVEEYGNSSNSLPMPRRSLTAELACKKLDARSKPSMISKAQSQSIQT